MTLPMFSPRMFPKLKKAIYTSDQGYIKNMQHVDTHNKTLGEMTEENQTTSQSHCGVDLCGQSSSDHNGETRSP